MSTVAPGRNDATHSKASSSGTEPGSEKKAESRSGRRTLARYPRYGPSCAAPVPRDEPPVGFAHRGGAGAHPENTERAFRHAVELGYRYLETDVHATADGVLIAFHDDKLDRVTDRTGRIIDLTWAEVSEARAAGSDPILRFDEMLQRFPEARINIDPKAETAVEPLADLILHYGVQDRVCVTSFSRRRTERVKRRVGSDLCTGGATGATIEAIVGLAGIGALRDVDVLQVPPVFGSSRSSLAGSSSSLTGADPRARLDHRRP